MSQSPADSDCLQFLLGVFQQIGEHDNFYDKVLKDTVNTLKDSSQVNVEKTFSVLRVLLLLYEKYSNSFTDTLIPFDTILNNLNIVLDSDNIQNNVLQNCLSVIASLYKIAFVFDSSENLQKLTQFYTDNIIYCKNNTLENLNAEKVCVRLKVLCAVYNTLEKLFENSCVSQEKLKQLNCSNIKEEKIFGYFVVHAAKPIAIQTLLFVIPQFIKCTKNHKLLNYVWEEVFKFVNINYKTSEILFVMCYLFDLFTKDSSTTKELVFSVLSNQSYWGLIEFNLTDLDPLNKKQAMYLFKRSVECLKNFNFDIIKSSEITDNTSKRIECAEGEIMWWDKSLNNDLYEIFSELIVILEFLDEQQIHIIKPILSMIDKIVLKMLTTFKNGKTIHYSWIILIYKKVLLHENVHVVKWGLQSLLLLPEFFYNNEFTTENVVDLLVPHLNNASLFYNDHLNISEVLTAFFNNILNLKTSESFFTLIILKMCQTLWVPEALFLITHAIAKVKKKDIWKNREISEIGNFVSQSLNTHNKIIRNGVEFELLHSVIKLTDVKDVSLENVMLLLSCFSSLTRGSKIWKDVVVWLRDSYSKETAEEYLNSFDTSEVKNFNEKLLALVLTLFLDVYQIRKPNCFVLNKVNQILSFFKNIQKRVYCDKQKHDCYLKVINHILEANLTSVEPDNGPLFQGFVLFLEDIISYIQIQGKVMLCLKDYHNCELYVETYENILKTSLLLNVDIKKICSITGEVVNDLEKLLTLDVINQPVQVYLGIKLLKALVCTTKVVPKTKFLVSHLLKNVNKPLEKQSDINDKTRDLQTLWGKMNSSYIETKWWLLEHFINDNKFSQDDIDNTKITNDVLIELCVEALTVGSYGILTPLMKIMKTILPKRNGQIERYIIDSVWMLIMERRKTDEFKIFIKQFVEMLFQKSLTNDGSVMKDVLFKYTDLLYSDTSLAVVNTFIKHIQGLGVAENTSELFCYILSKGLIFGSVPRKGEKLTNQVCAYIESLELSSVGDLNTSNQVRASAVQIILSLDNNNISHQTFAENIVKMLINIETEMNKNKIRYFGDSQVHRIKHRVMQALLLLEPIVNENQEKAEKLLNYLYRSLMLENPQPSVKYQLEWLLIRLLIKYRNLLNKFWNFFTDSVDKKNKGLCSLISITYHLCKLISNDFVEEFIKQGFIHFLPYCMDQHFEVRLYSQVVLEKLYNLAKVKQLEDITKNHEMIYSCIRQSIERGFQGNASKNCSKLKEDFYLNIFNPLQHYSLQTIYTDLPRLANIGSDEWISVKDFKNCGIKPENIGIPLENKDDVLENVEKAKWVLEKSSPGVLNESGEDISEDLVSVNYQKKLIPVIPLLTDLDVQHCEGGNDFVKSKNVTKKDGLVVVATLIDRIPNLGGLARTCEIFGASEYVISSLKYTEDKQFSSLSVTAEKWVNIREVKLQNLSDYILTMKENGYTVVGAEQALFSRPLNDVKFPKKSLIFLGNEKEGIPANLLPLLDICVEIPQVGLIRSLNVHVTGALFIWEYAKQNYFSDSVEP